MNEQKFDNRQERVQFQTSSIWLLNADWLVLRLLVVFFFLIRQSMSPRPPIRRVPLRFRSGGDFDQSAWEWKGELRGLQRQIEKNVQWITNTQISVVFESTTFCSE